MDSPIKSSNPLTYKDDRFMTMVEDFLNTAIETDSFKDAYVLSRSIINFLSKRKKELEQLPEVNDFYRKILIKAEFVGLPLLDDGEIVELLKNNFAQQFEIPAYDLLAKFKRKLITIPVYEDRDVLREEVKKILLSGAGVLTSGPTAPRTVAEWLRDYNAKLGIARIDSLKRSQYFSDLTKNSKLNDKDREKLKTLFDLYEETKLSSLDPLGYDDEVPVVVNGQLYVYKRGRLEKIESSEIKIKGLSTGEGKGVEKIGTEAKAGIEPENNIPPARQQQLEELRQILNSYPEQSLPRKAVEEEIRKISKK